MINAPAAFKDFLVADAPLFALVGNRIWPQRADPLPGYKPQQGGAIAFVSRGGPPDYSGTLLTLSWQCKCYAIDEEAAELVSMALGDAVHQKQSWPILWLELESAGQPSYELHPQWPYVLVHVTTKMLFNPVEA